MKKYYSLTVYAKYVFMRCNLIVNVVLAEKKRPYMQVGHFKESFLQWVIAHSIYFIDTSKQNYEDITIFYYVNTLIITFVTKYQALYEKDKTSIKKNNKKQQKMWRVKWKSYVAPRCITNQHYSEPVCYIAWFWIISFVFCDFQIYLAIFELADKK